MKARYLFARISFVIICGLLVSFSFVREFATLAESERTALHQPIPENMVNVKILDCEDNLVYKSLVDLKDATRKKDGELIKLLKASEFVRKDQHTIFFRLLK